MPIERAKSLPVPRGSRPSRRGSEVVDEAVDHLVQGAVTAGGHHHPGAAAHGLAGDLAGVPSFRREAHFRAGEPLQGLAQGLDLAGAPGVGLTTKQVFEPAFKPAAPGGAPHSCPARRGRSR